MKTEKTKEQYIKRSDLFSIYKQVCEGWKTIITEILVDQRGDQIYISNELINKAYNEANPDQKKLIEKFFSIKAIGKITDIIKTLKDVYNYHGVKKEDVLPFKNPKTKLQRHLNAVVNINLISEALNEGFVFDWKNSNQFKYYPYFKKSASGWVVDSFAYYCVVDLASLGFGCYFKSSDLALYAGNQFIEVYKDYLPE